MQNILEETSTFLKTTMKMMDNTSKAAQVETNLTVILMRQIRTLGKEGGRKDLG